MNDIERELREALAEQPGWEGLLPEGPGLREATLPQRVDSLIRRLASDHQGAVEALREVEGKLADSDRSRKHGNSGVANTLVAEALAIARRGGQ
jgi:hypothetical protein